MLDRFAANTISKGLMQQLFPTLGGQGRDERDRLRGSSEARYKNLTVGVCRQRVSRRRDRSPFRLRTCYTRINRNRQDTAVRMAFKDLGKDGERATTRIRPGIRCTSTHSPRICFSWDNDLDGDDEHRHIEAQRGISVVLRWAPRSLDLIENRIAGSVAGPLRELRLQDQLCVQ